jgi:hypothetical protein
VCPIRPSILYVEHPKNGTCGVFQHNRHEADQSCISVFEQKADLHFTRSISLFVALTMVAERARGTGWSSGKIL